QIIRDTDETGTLQADAHQLKQVLVNLINNAAESIGHNGQVTLHARTDTATLRQGLTKAVILEVEDTGPGIPEELQEQIFQPFFTTKEGGTGMGLSVATRIVDKHGG